MNKLLCIISLFSVIWSNGLLHIINKLGYLEGAWRMLAGAVLIYTIVALYNIFTMVYSFKVQKEKASFKAPSIPGIIAMVGNALYFCCAGNILIILLSECLGRG